MEERDYWIAWSGCPGVGPVRFGQLITTFGSAKEAWKADKKALGDLGYRGEGLGKLLSYRESYDFEKSRREMEKWGIVAVTQVDEGYPSSLKEIGQAPMVVYGIGKGFVGADPRVRPSVEGQTHRFAPTDAIPLLAVVGTRKVTAYGRQVTEMLTRGLVDAGLGIVSGLMYGVDEVAHRTCVEAGGMTVGVWAGGLDTVFGGSRKPLAELIVNKGGILMSEYPLGMQPSVQTFPYRNRIVAGLSVGVLVTEGTEGSGTLITAGYAAEQGKEVFAVPGPITSQQSQAPSKLIKSGAKLVTGVGDILEELSQGIGYRGEGLGKKNSEFRSQNLEDLNGEERQIWELLKNEAMSVDEVARNLKKSAGEVGSVLSLMELRGWVRRMGESWSVNG